MVTAKEDRNHNRGSQQWTNIELLQIKQKIMEIFNSKSQTFLTEIEGKFPPSKNTQQTIYI